MKINSSSVIALSAFRRCLLAKRLVLLLKRKSLNRLLLEKVTRLLTFVRFARQTVITESFTLSESCFSKLTESYTLEFPELIYKPKVIIIPI